jgi:hypothetical protein
VVGKPGAQPLVEPDDPRVEVAFDMFARLATADHRDDLGHLGPSVDRQHTEIKTQLNLPSAGQPELITSDGDDTGRDDVFLSLVRGRR